MQRYKWPLCGLVVVLVSLLVGSGLSAQTRTLPKRTVVWQYKVLDVFKVQERGGKSYGIEAGLNKLGAEGWELVAIQSGVPKPSSVTAADADSSKPVYFVQAPLYHFKRQAQR